MKPLKKSIIKFLKSRARWNQKIQSNAINDEDVDLIVNTSILGELCYEFLHFKKPIHFQFLDIGSLLDSESNLFFEYLCLERKYQSDFYQEAHATIVENYQDISKDLYKSNPTLDTFSLILLVSLLQKKNNFPAPKENIKITAELIEDQPREAIEAIVDFIFFHTQFGLKKNSRLNTKSIEALESILLEAVNDFDFLFVSRLLRMFAYVEAPKSKATKKAVRFLRKFTPKRRNLILEVVTEKGRQKLDEDTEMVKLNKEIIIAVLEWKTDFRFYRDFGSTQKS
ncbi:hypothetical protein EZY14_019415 [Kordia sp. TARA_039_SRF]|nr:hypothetical protein EZY14_019415 [Kordia sp. TARA_039_SRF]